MSEPLGGFVNATQQPDRVWRVSYTQNGQTVNFYYWTQARATIEAGRLHSLGATLTPRPVDRPADTRVLS